MNRVEELYKLACDFLGLTDMTRFIIGTHFKAIDANEFWIDIDKANQIIFCKSIKKDCSGFKRHVEFRKRLNNVH